MSKDLNKGKRKLDDDYSITNEALVSRVDLPGRLVSLISPIFNVLLVSGLVLFSIYNILKLDIAIESAVYIALGVGAVIFILGILGGVVWQIIARIMAKATYTVYLSENKSIIQKIFGWFYVKFVEKDAQVYLEARAEDPRLGNIFNLFKLITRISISQVSFFIISIQFLSRPAVQYIRSLLPTLDFTITQVLIAQNVAAIGLSVLFITLYLPMSFLIEDSNIRTWVGKSRTISTPSASIRSQIDNIISFSAILTGWGIYLAQIDQQQSLLVLERLRNQWVISGVDLVLYLDYAIWIFGLMLLSWPLILPAAYYYFRTYHKTINRFRRNAHKNGVPIGVSKVRLPDMIELEVIHEFMNSEK